VREEWNNRSEGGMGQSEWGRNGTIGVREEWNNRSEGGMEQSESTCVVFRTSTGGRSGIPLDMMGMSDYNTENLTIDHSQCLDTTTFFACK
jgi:hypothetical protein